MAGTFGTSAKARAQLEAVKKAMEAVSAQVAEHINETNSVVSGTKQTVVANSEELVKLGEQMTKLQKSHNLLQGIIEDVEAGRTPSLGASVGSGDLSPIGFINDILRSEGLKGYRSAKADERRRPYPLGTMKASIVRGRRRMLIDRSKAPDATMDNTTNPGVVKPWYKPEIVDLRQAAVRVFDLFPRIPVDSDTVEYDRENAEFPWVACLTADILAGATSTPLDTVIGLGDQAPYNQITLSDGTNTETVTISAIDTGTNTLTTSATTNAFAAADTTVSAQCFRCTPQSQLKPRAVHKIVPIQKKVCTMAVWEDASVQILMDDNRLERFLRLKLLDLVARMAEKGILYGYTDSNGVGFPGIFEDASVPEYPWSTGVVGDSRIDHLVRVTFEVVKQNYFPTDVLLTPDDLRAIFMQKDGESAYLFIRDLSAEFPSNFFGLRITWSNQLETTTTDDPVNPNGGDFVLGDFEAAAVIYDREQMSLQVGMKNDDFVRNIRTLLAEMRLTFCIERPLALARGTFDNRPS